MKIEINIKNDFNTLIIFNNLNLKKIKKLINEIKA